LGNSQHEPVITRVAENRLMLGRDSMSILIDSEGNPTQKNPITWTGIPSEIGNTYCKKYELSTFYNKNIHRKTKILRVEGF
jgi:hypothetical protein